MQPFHAVLGEVHLRPPIAAGTFEGNDNATAETRVVYAATDAQPPDHARLRPGRAADPGRG